MPLRRPPAGRYGGAEGPGQLSRERVDPGKADTAPKAAPGPRGRRAYSLAFGHLRWARDIYPGPSPRTPPRYQPPDRFPPVTSDRTSLWIFMIR